MSWLGKALFTRVNSFVEALVSMICELKLLHSFKKIVQKFHGDPTFRLKVISEKQYYAVMKYIVVQSVYKLWFTAECSIDYDAKQLVHKV